MAFIDFAVKTDENDSIADVFHYGEKSKWFEEIDWSFIKHENFYTVFKIDHTGQVIEFHNRFFTFQKVEWPPGSMYYFSSSDVLKSLFEETLEKVSEGVQIYDKNGYFLYSNAASQKLGDYKRESFEGRHLLDIYDLTEEISTVLSVLRTDASVTNRCDVFKGKDGKELLTINNGFPLKIDGRLYGAVSFEGDMTTINQLKNRSFNLEAFIRNEKPVVEKKGFCFDDILHQSEAMGDLIRFAKKISLTDTNVLITGETGTGKELFAQSIHNYSPRRDMPFIDINCGAVPSNLVESVFFGTEKGAFTGSIAKKGLLEIADGGTLFLDEVNSMGMEMQAKLLRALQENRFQRIGGHEYIKCNVRIIAASNEDLRKLSSENLFRKDLYYRLSTLSINVPPLRDRKSDIQLLMNQFIVELSKKYGKRKLEYSKAFRKSIETHDWPGNVRELHHAIEFAVNHMPDASNVLNMEDLPTYLAEKHVVEVKEDKMQLSVLVGENETLNEKLDKVEEFIIKQALHDHFGNITKAAQSLGLSRQSLQYRMSKFENAK